MVKSDSYKHDLVRLQTALVRYQKWAMASGAKALVIFEGRDGAGKDGTIKRIIEHLAPRNTRAISLPKPSDRQRTEWYFQRYIPLLPAAGDFVIFNRSWYNRAGVEPVMGFCTPRETEDFLRDVPSLERMLEEADIRLVKIWLDIDKKEQAARLDSRREDPLKQLKVSDLDKLAQKKWKAYSRARDEMLRRTHTAIAPWICVRADAKVGRASVEVVLDQFGCGAHQRDPPGLGAFAVQRHHHRAGRSDLGGVQVADLLDARGRVVEGGEQDRVAQPAPGGWVWFGQESLDLVASEVAHVDGRSLLLLDGDDLGGLVEELWPFDRGIPDKRFDDGEALVAGRRRVAAFGLEPVQEAEHGGAIEDGEAQFFGWCSLLVTEPGEQQPDGVSIGGDGLGGQVPLPGQVVSEEFRQPLAGQVPAGWVDAAHGSNASGVTGSGMT